MAKSSGRVPRLYIDAPLAEGACVPLSADHVHYLGTVLRLESGSAVYVFNTAAGEWSGVFSPSTKRSGTLQITHQRHPPAPPQALTLLFAPIKRARTEIIVEKATEMGCAAIRPVITDYTQHERFNLERLASISIEAAEQCELRSIPTLTPAAPLDQALDALAPETRLVFCDETLEGADPVATLQSLPKSDPPPPCAILIGPEGGFSPDERARLRARTAPTVILSLGPRILRADTAAVAALTLISAQLGDWRTQRT